MLIFSSAFHGLPSSSSDGEEDTPAEGDPPAEELGKKRSSDLHSHHILSQAYKVIVDVPDPPSATAEEGEEQQQGSDSCV